MTEHEELRDHIEIAAVTSYGSVFIRNSNNPGKVLVFSTEEWEAFKEGVKLGEFDL